MSMTGKGDSLGNRHCKQQKSPVLWFFTTVWKNKQTKNNKDKAEPDSETILPVQKMYLEGDTEAFF